MKTPVQDTLPPRWRKLARWLVGLFLLYVVVGFLILPPIIRALAVKQLSKQLDREVSIEQVKLNPLTLSATVRGLLIKDPDGQPFVSWDEVYVNFQISSLFGHTWIFKEVSTSKTFVRVQMNKDYTFNFSDLVTKFSTNALPQKPSSPLALRIDRLHIDRASASLTDLTPRLPFKRMLGPLDVTMVNFETDPKNRNPYSFAGITDAGEKFSWSGYFYLDPLRSQGEFSLENLRLNTYAPLYQDFVRFQIKDGIVDVRSTYLFELSATNRIAAVRNTSFRLHSFVLAEPDSESNLAELPDFSVTNARLDVIRREAEIGAITATGGKLFLRRTKDNAINVVELAKPAADATNASGGILFLLRSVTNAVALLLNSTNQWAGTIHDVNFTNCALNLEDLVNSRPARLELEDIDLSAKHISNVPGTNLAAALSLRWNTNGTIKLGVEASFSPPTAEVQLTLDRLELRTLDPYLEPKLNVFVLGSKLSLDGRVHLRTVDTGLPEVTFAGDVRLDDFSTVDGELGEDLLKWGSFRISGIEAALNPPAIAVKEVALDDAYARVVIETNHTINLLTALRLGNTNAPPAEEVPAKKTESKKPPVSLAETAAPVANALSALPKISIASVVISNAQMSFTDHSVTPDVNLTIEQAGGTITGLSSEELQHADINLHAMVDNIGPATITGTMNPFRENMTNELKITVKDVDLTPASPYVGKFAGYQLAKGKLELNLTYHLHERKLKSENLIVLDQFTFGEKVDSPDATRLPVRLAIAILKDRNGKIELNVPVEGSLDDPEFRVRKVILHTLVNIIEKIATSPFSVLGALFGARSEELNFQDFTAGSFELLPAGKGKLDGLVKGLYERPALELDIEGSVDPTADREGLRRVALEKQLRDRKWMTLRKTERATITAEQVELTPEERSYWLKKLYSDAVAKDEISSGAAVTNQPSATAPAAPVAPVVSAADLKRRSLRSSPDMKKGATALMHRGDHAVAVSVPGKPPTAVEAPPQGGVVDEMEARLLNSIAVSDSDFAALAAARAQAVRDYILQSGKVGGERLFLVKNQPGGVKSQGTRAYLQLK